MSIFGDYRQSLAPPWLSKQAGRDMANALGEVEDATMTAAKDAVKASFPSVAPDDALDRIGAEMQLPRSPSEVGHDDVYRARLQNAFSAWVWAGTKKGLVDYGIKPFGYTNIRVITTRDWAHLSEAGTAGVNVPDGNTSKWARFWIVAGRPPAYDTRTWNQWQPTLSPSSYSRTETWGTKASYSQAAALKHVIDLWRPAWAQIVGIWIVPLTGSINFKIDDLPLPGGDRWLEERSIFDDGDEGIGGTFWRYNHIIHTTP